MAFINQDEINKLRQSVNIVDIIGDYLPLTKKGKNFFAVCPFHDDHSPSMSVSEERQIYRCFTCEKSGNVFSFVEDYENVSFPEAVSIVAQKVGFSLTEVHTKKKETKFDILYKIMEIANKFFQNNLKTESGKQAKNYLLSRRINETTIDDFKIGLSLDSKDILTKLLLNKGFEEKMLIDLGLSFKYENSLLDQFCGRIMFPLYDKDGQVVGFTGRIYRNEESSKYINSKETIIFKKGFILYNYNFAKEYAKRTKTIILVEGQMDAIRLSTEGIKNVVAISGTSLTKEQIGLIKQLRSNVILCLDNDIAGKEATYRIGEALIKEGIETKVAVFDEAKDPDEYIIKYGADKFKNVINQPIKYFDYKLSYLKSNKDLNNSVDLTNYINEVVKSLENETDELLIDITLKKLCHEYDLDISILKGKLKNMKPKVPVKTETIKLKEKKNKYDKACEQMLYFMMIDIKYIKMYQKKLGFIPIKKYRDIANEVQAYYELNKCINLPDFISFVSNNEEISSLVHEIIGSIFEDITSEEEMDIYINTIRELIKKDEIERLKEELKNNNDPNKKLELLSKIAKIKKEVLK